MEERLTAAGGELLATVRAGVATVTLNRPAQLNALSFGMLEGLSQWLAAWLDDPRVRIVLLRGAGDKAFCAGADLKTYTMTYAQSPAPEFRTRYTDGPGFGGITRGLEMPKPVIAAVNGYAISGGFELALACDIRFASPHAEFALQDVRWGFHACDGGLIRLPQIVGLGHAMEIVLSGDRIGAERALAIGLVNRIVPQADLVAEALAYAARLASRAPLPQRFAKDVMRRAVGLPLEEALRLESRSFQDLAFTQDLAEGTTAFREKRDAAFKGR